MSSTCSYWMDQIQFRRQTKLLEEVFEDQVKGYVPGGNSNISFETLGDRQRKTRIGCVYFAGGRIDSKFCLGTKNVGLLHSALPTDYTKAIRPAFHGNHDELMLCTHGWVVIEYCIDQSKDAPVTTVTLKPGDYLLVQRGWPHKVSLKPLRDRSLDLTPAKELEAGFLAVKMGSLTGKSLDEDLTQWKAQARTQPLIGIWREDERLLSAIAENDRLCEKLSIDQKEIKRIIAV